MDGVLNLTFIYIISAKKIHTSFLMCKKLVRHLVVLLADYGWCIVPDARAWERDAAGGIRAEVSDPPWERMIN